MDFDSWVFTIAVLFCAIALALYEPKEPKTCEIYHEGNNFCTTYDGDRMHHHTN